MPWLVEILNDTVRMEIKSLPADIQARFLHLSDLIAQSGLDRIGEPHVKHLEGKRGRCGSKDETVSLVPCTLL